MAPDRLRSLSVSRCQRGAIVGAGCDAHDSVMTTPKLCVKCIAARDDKFFKRPAHLVHPQQSKLTAFDTYGIAVCPTCGAIWHRDRNRTVLFKRQRLIPVLIKERKSSNKVVTLQRSGKQ